MISLPHEVEQSFFGGTSIELLNTAPCGASGPRVVFLRNGQPTIYALKYGNTRVPIHEQLENRKVLAEFMPHRLPKVLKFCEYPGGEAMLMEAIPGPNLHYAVVESWYPDSVILHLVDSILGEFAEMWRRSRSTEILQFKRNFFDRAAIVKVSIENALRQLGIPPDAPLVINGTPIGKPLELAQVLDTFQAPPFSVICHYDLHADNFFLDARPDWFLGDWEWAGRHDYKASLTHLYSWWMTTCARLKTDPEVKLRGDHFELNYWLYLPELCEQIRGKCVEQASFMADELGDSPHWEKNFWLHAGCDILGDLRFIGVRNRQPYLPALLGEGLLLLHRAATFKV
ncbi:MAG: aminoglycoside phosphotransferase family protein [Patescibacteria group bacterium]|nr:aminoglycoside phosphotransferase family protein [Patescibacteria group bacterium]